CHGGLPLCRSSTCVASSLVRSGAAPGPVDEMETRGNSIDHSVTRYYWQWKGYRRDGVLAVACSRAQARAVRADTIPARELVEVLVNHPTNTRIPGVAVV